MFITQIALKRPITVLMFFLLILLCGGISFHLLPIELYPDVSLADVTIIYKMRGGMAAFDVERLVTVPVEKALAGLHGVRRSYSKSEHARATVLLEFDPQTDMDSALAQIHERLMRIRKTLPDAAERPVIARYRQGDAPIMVIALRSADDQIESVGPWVEGTLKDQLGRVAGVAHIEVSGLPKTSIIVDVDEARMETFGITYDTIVGWLSQSNIHKQVGTVEFAGSMQSVRLDSSVNDVRDIQQLVLLGQADGENPLLLSDVAQVERRSLEPESYARLNGTPVVALFVHKESQANTLQCVADLEEKISAIRRSWMPPTVSIDIITDQAYYIKDAAYGLLSALAFGALFAGLLFLFMMGSPVHSMIVLATIPFTLAFSLSFLYVLGVSLNVMTLSGLALGIGLVLDNSIVVLDNIVKRGRKVGIPKACSEMFVPLLTSTFTTGIVFLPLVFISENTRPYFEQLAYSVCASIISSLFFAFTLIPALAQRWDVIHRRDVDRIRFIERQYLYLLKPLLRRRYLLYLCIPLVLLYAWTRFGDVQEDLLKEPPRGRFTITCQMSPGTRLEYVNATALKMESELQGISEIRYFATDVQHTIVKIYVMLHRGVHGIDVVTEKLIQALRPSMETIAQQEEAFVYFSEFEGAARELSIDVLGDDIGVLKRLAGEIGDNLRKVPSITDVKFRHQEGSPELVLKLDPAKVVSHGLDIQQVSHNLNGALVGYEPTKVYLAGRLVEVVSRFRHIKKKLSEIGKINIAQWFARPVFLSQVASFHIHTVASQIWRKNRSRVIRITAASFKLGLKELAEKLLACCQGVTFDDFHFYEIGEEYEEMLRLRWTIFWALILSLVLIYIALTGLFESFYLSLLVMVVPLVAFAGCVLVFALLQVEVTLGATLGVIVLGGISVNAAIIMLYRVRRLSERFLLLGGILRAARERVHAILISGLTTVFGLLPMTFGFFTSSGIWRGMAITVIAGLLFAVPMTLFLIPALYLTCERIRMRFSGCK